MYEYENLTPVQIWLHSIKSGEPIIIEGISTVARTLPQEYSVYKRLTFKSLVAVSFGPNPLGFLIFRNPQKYVRLTSTCLTTINNLSEPVRKLDGQVMKITYDIVDEEG